MFLSEMVRCCYKLIQLIRAIVNCYYLNFYF